MTGDTEEWRPIVGWERHYEVSNQGRIRSLDRWVRRADWQPVFRAGRIMKVAPSPNGYLGTVMTLNGRRNRVSVHRAVVTAFAGSIPAGHEVRHLDGDRQNNHLSNLATGTHSTNMLDAVAHGTHRNTRKAECKYGHRFSEDNTSLTQGGVRECLACRRIKNRTVTPELTYWDVREWAWANGLECGRRGAISRDLIVAYLARRAAA